MDLVEMLGMEDNPFGLFLILILLLGATGRFDLPGKKSEAEVTPEGAWSAPAIVMPIWQKQPAAQPANRFGFRAALKDVVDQGSVRPGVTCGSRRSLLQTLLAPQSQAERKDSLSPGKDIAGFLRRVWPLRSRHRHPLIRVRHRMLQ